MNLEATGFSSTRRLVRDDGSVGALVEKMTNDKWMIFVNGKRATHLQFDTPYRAMIWARENMK